MERRIDLEQLSQTGDLAHLATWNRPRSIGELQNFIARRESSMAQLSEESI